MSGYERRERPGSDASTKGLEARFETRRSSYLVRSEPAAEGRNGLRSQGRATSAGEALGDYHAVSMRPYVAWIQQNLPRRLRTALLVLVDALRAIAKRPVLKSTGDRQVTPGG